MRPRKTLLFLILLSAILFQRSDPFRERSPAVEVLWRFDAGGCLTHTPTPAGEVVYVASGNGIVWQLEASHRIAMDDGRILASKRVDGKPAPRGALVVDADSLIVQLADGRSENQALVSIDRFLKRVSWRIAAVQRWSTSRVFALEEHRRGRDDLGQGSGVLCVQRPSRVDS